MSKNIQLTGNPFVDTGLYVLSYLAKVDEPEQLTLKKIRAVYGDGSELAKVNARLKSFTMVFGPNNPLSQSSFRPKGNQKIISEKNIKAYTGVLSSFLHEMEQSSPNYPLCEICGCEHSLNFDAAVRPVLMAAGAKDRGAKQVGRDWIPLTGSIGNDAQSLPSASRSLSVCAKCLFVVHYMPLGMMLFDKKLVCFQSNQQRIAMELTAELASEYLEILRTKKGKLGDEKIETKGKGDKTTVIVKHLLSWMEKRQTVIKEEDLPDSVTLYAWLFENQKIGDCQIVEIPSDTLQFLWQARKCGYKNDLLSILAGEGKLPVDVQLFSCIRQSRDYSRLYPFKTIMGASPGLFALYHQIILNESAQALKGALSLAQARLKETTPKEQKNLKKARMLEENPDERKRFKKLMLDLVKDGRFNPTDYHLLFPASHFHPIKVEFRGWKTIGYYLSHPDAEVPDFSEESRQVGGNMKPHPKIKQMARLYFDDYLARKGVEHFRKHVIDGFNRTYPNGLQWLRDVYLNLAKEHAGLTLEDWDEFVQDENGQPQANELLFQMRLELTNLYRECMQNPIEPK